MKEVIPLKRNSVNLHVQLVKLWVSITRTVTSQFTIQWFEWPRSFRSGIRLSMGKATSVRSMATPRLLCDILRADLTEFLSICWKISKRKLLISNRILMIQKWSQQYCLHDFQIFFSTVRTVSRLVWQPVSLHTISQKLQGQSAFMFNGYSKREKRIKECQVFRLKSTWNTSTVPTSLLERQFMVSMESSICTILEKDASMFVPDVMSSTIRQENVSLFMKSRIRLRNRICLSTSPILYQKAQLLVSVTFEMNHPKRVSELLSR